MSSQNVTPFPCQDLTAPPILWVSLSHRPHHVQQTVADCLARQAARLVTCPSHR